MGLIKALGAGPFALDTVVFIYLIEEHPSYLPILRPLFSAIDEGRCVAVTSALTLLETLVVPYRAGNLALADRYEALLTRSRIRLVEFDSNHMRTAAQLRAVTAVRTPDALQLAAAMSAHCTAFVTNDRDLPSLPGLRIFQLKEYTES